MTRDEALLELEKPPFDPAAILQDFDYIATKLGITTDELKDYHQMSKNFYWDYRSRHRLLCMINKAVTVLKIGRRGGAF